MTRWMKPVPSGARRLASPRRQNPEADVAAHIHCVISPVKGKKVPSLRFQHRSMSNQQDDPTLPPETACAVRHFSRFHIASTMTRMPGRGVLREWQDPEPQAGRGSGRGWMCGAGNDEERLALAGGVVRWLCPIPEILWVVSSSKKPGRQHEPAGAALVLDRGCPKCTAKSDPDNR